MKVRKTAVMLVVMIVMWFVASWMNVLAHNDPFDGDYRYAPWNVITLTTEIIKSI